MYTLIPLFHKFWSFYSLNFLNKGKFPFKELVVKVSYLMWIQCSRQKPESLFPAKPMAGVFLPSSTNFLKYKKSFIVWTFLFLNTCIFIFKPWFGFTAFQKYFFHFGQSQIVRWIKKGDHREKKTPGLICNQNLSCLTFEFWPQHSPNPKRLSDLEICF